MGPLIFNLYVQDLEANINATCHQYADDTTLYKHCKPSNLQQTVTNLQDTMNHLNEWASDANLRLNPTKTKVMIFSTPQLSSFHSIDNASVEIKVKDITLERVSKTKLLGAQLHQHMKWEDNVKTCITACYSTLTSLKKLKRMLPFNLRKNIVQSLVLSKLHYNDIIYHDLPDYLEKRLERVQKAAASFVLNRYASRKDIIALQWLPIREHYEWNILKSVHKALHDPSWPNYLPINIHNTQRTLRSTKAPHIEIPAHISNTFQDHAARAFNSQALGI